MDRVELENLVRTIVEKVLTQLQNSGMPITAASQPATGAFTKPDPVEAGTFSQKHLFTEPDMVAFAREGVVKLIVTPTAIITPSAKDYARDKGIQIQRGRQSATDILPGAPTTASMNSLAVLAARVSATEKRSLFEAIEAQGMTPVEIPVERATTAGMSLVLNQMAKQVSAGIYRFGIVVDENAFSLSIQANKIEDIRGVVCWDVSSAEVSHQESRANMLFLNNRLLGLRSLNEITQVWLTNSKNAL